jgi:hypothetical protein
MKRDQPPAKSAAASDIPHSDSSNKIDSSGGSDSSDSSRKY